MTRSISYLTNPQYALAYVLTYFIVAEWLYPLPEISDTGFLMMFLFIAGIFFVIMAIPMHWLIRLGIYALVLTYSVHALFMPGTYLSIDWWTLLFTEIFQQSTLVFSGGLLQLSDMYRTFLLLLLLAMVSYLAYYWVVIAQRVFFFVTISIVYIGFLDTFTAFDGSWAMIRLVVIGFVLFACMRFSVLHSRYPNLGGNHWVRFFAMAFIVIALSAVIGWQAPKYAQQWSDPTPYIESTTGMDVIGWDTSSNGEETRKIGYGESDEQLGGSFVMDDIEVFTARAETSSYWRGESKHEYTGHGWESAEEGELTEQSEGHVDLYEGATDTNTLEADVSYHNPGSGNGDLLFSQGALQEASAEMETDYSMSIHNENGRAELWFEDDVGDSLDLTLTYEHAEFPVEQMREVDQSGDPESVRDKYIQLPDELPDRIEDLAEDLVEGETNRYDRARAIESYLNGPDFDYETTDIPVPADDQDYVDQFLFETQIGYCDNFSTAMVVMLRTLDIPARWVKGFTPGEEVNVADDGYQEFEVTNENAHSWVEVYFPDVGWVPFEPTPGFSNTVDFAMADVDTEENDEEMTFEQDSEQMTDEMNENEEAEDGDEEENASKEHEADQSSMPFWVLTGIGTGLLLVSLVAVRYRGKIVKVFIRRRYQGMNSGTMFMGAYESLLWYLDWIGMKKAKHETPSEFAERIDLRFNSEDMSILTLLYEDLYYGNKKPDQLPSDTEQRWRALLDNITI